MTAALDIDDNLLIVYQKQPAEMTTATDEPDFAPFLQKYIELGVIAAAYRANTDGQIASLADYWDFRKQIAVKMIRRFVTQTKADRDYCMTTKGVPVRVAVRHPRLPDTYPDV